MKYLVQIKILNSSDIVLELDDRTSPNTVTDMVESLPFTVSLNTWGDEIYPSESPVAQSEENSKEIVDLYDVAYWPTGKAICLFYGSTPIGTSDKITPASPVNIIGKIISPNKMVLNDVSGQKATFSLKS